MDKISDKFKEAGIKEADIEEEIRKVRTGK